MIEKYYVAGCVDNGLGVDQVEDQDAEFWTLYARDGSGESEAQADFTDRRSAETAMAVYVERDALNEQVRALAAEVQSCRRFVADELGPESGVQFSGLTTERTDAILREVGAKALDDMATEFGQIAQTLKPNSIAYRAAKSSVFKCVSAAARIRAGEVPDA